MRLSMFDTSFTFNNKGEFNGINLGWDFVAEHEFGIKGICFSLGINDEKFYEINKSKILKIPKNLTYAPIIINKHKYYVLTMPTFNLVKDDFTKNGNIKNNYTRVFDFYDFIIKEKKLMASWDSNSFAICVKKEDKDKLEKLYNAFQNKDIIVCFNDSDSGNPYSNKGLCFIINSLNC